MDIPRLAKFQFILWYLLEAHHVDPLLIFAKADLDPQVMYKEDGTYPLSKILNLWDEAAEAVADPAFGLKGGRCWHPSFLGSLGYGLMMCPSIRSTLETIIKYNSLVTSESVVSLTEDLERNTLKFTAPAEEFRPGAMARENAWMSCMQSLLKFDSVRRFNFIEVNFCHKEPDDLSKYYAVFQCPINFESESTSFMIRSKDADFVLPVASQSLIDFSEKEMTNYLLQQKIATFSYRISLRLEQILSGGVPSIEEMAEKLRLSTKSLQRILKKEGTNFQNILDTTRSKLAEKYLAQEKEISEIAYLLGYSEQSAFSRSFKKLHGISPSEYRKQVVQGRVPFSD